MKTIGDHHLIELKNIDQLPHPASQMEKLMQGIMGVAWGERNDWQMLRLAWRYESSSLLQLPKPSGPGGILLLDSQI